MPEISLPAPTGSLAIANVIKEAGLTGTTSEAMRMIQQGGVKLDGEKISDKALQLAAGASVVLQIGKRKFARVKII